MIHSMITCIEEHDTHILITTDGHVLLPEGQTANKYGSRATGDSVLQQESAHVCTILGRALDGDTVWRYTLSAGRSAPTFVGWHQEHGLYAFAEWQAPNVLAVLPIERAQPHVWGTACILFAKEIGEWLRRRNTAPIPRLNSMMREMPDLDITF